MPSRHALAADARRQALEARLRRLKRVAVAAAVASSIVLWGLVALAIPSATAAPQQATTPTNEDDRLRADFFGNGSFLGTGVGVTPVIRSHGS